MKLSADELASWTLSPESLESAVNQVKLNGFVLFEELLPADQVDELNQAFLKVLEHNLANNPQSTELNTHPSRKNRIRMDLPFEAPFIDPSIITNGIALPIIEKLLGEDCRCFYFSVDAPLPGSDYQGTHGDYSPFFPESTLTLPTTAIVVNFPLVDVTEENGPMDAWPGGTHLTPEYLFGDNQKHVVSASSFIEPVKMTMPKGSMIIRDVRMWHRGTPNRSNEIRPNMALIYARGWFSNIYYPQETLGITTETYATLSERAQKLFRYEKLVDTQTDKVEVQA